MKENSFFVLLGFVGIISIAGLVLMFTNFQSAAGGVFFEGRGFAVSCKDLTNVLKEKTALFKQQSELNPFDRDLREQYENMVGLERTYKGYSLGLKRFNARV